jgi:hypothetical protein
LSWSQLGFCLPDGRFWCCNAHEKGILQQKSVATKVTKIAKIELQKASWMPKKASLSRAVPVLHGFFCDIW